MATLDAYAIRLAIRERLEGVLAGARAIAIGELSGDAFVGASTYTRQMRASVAPRFIVRISSQRRSDAALPACASIRMLELDVAIVYTYKLPNPANMPDVYETEKARADGDVDTMARALEWPGALDVTSAGRATGIVSGLLRFDSSTVVTEDAASGLYEIQSTHTAIVVVDVDAEEATP